MGRTTRFDKRRPVANRPEIEEYLASRPPVEMDLAQGIVRRIWIIGPVMVALFGAFRGLDGAVAATTGVVMVAGYYLATGWILSATARVSLGTYYAGALFGFFVRLVLVGITMTVLTNQFGLDKIALGATVAVTYVALLTWEAAQYGKRNTKATSDRVSSARRHMGDDSGV